MLPTAWLGVSLRVELDTVLDDAIREIHQAYEKAKEIAEVQAKMAVEASR